MPPAIRMGWAVSSSTYQRTPRVNATVNQMIRLIAPRMNCARSRASTSAVVIAHGVEAVDGDDFSDAESAVRHATWHRVPLARSKLADFVTNAKLHAPRDHVA